MANGKEHRRVGQIAGAGFAAYRARHQDPGLAVLEAVGGVYGGAHGARLHDVIEPATNPNHRGVGHSVVANGAVIGLGRATLDDFQSNLRRWAAEQLDQARDSETPLLEALVRVAGAVGAHLLVGYTNGFVGGAVSHLALDAPTAKSIPMLVRGF
jgi:hypothetical protein